MSRWACRLGPELLEKSNSYTPTGKDGHTGKNPELFLAQNMISHLGIYRTELMRRAGGFRTGFEGSQDWDLALRVVELSAPTRIRHIPHILYHWRVYRTSGSFSTDHGAKAAEAGRRAVA